MKLEDQENSQQRIEKAIHERAAIIKNEMPKIFMGLILDYTDGQTPLEEEEKEGLLIPGINTEGNWMNLNSKI